MLLSEHVYCSSFKMSEWVEQRVYMKLCIMLEHSSVETIQMIQKASAMCNWWLAASSQQCACTCIKSFTEFFVKHQKTQPRWLSPLQLRFGDQWLLAFPKTKITFEREEISDINEIQENMTGQLTVTGRTVWGLKVPTLKGTKVSLSSLPLFLYLVSSSVNVSIFDMTWLDTSEQNCVCVWERERERIIIIFLLADKYWMLTTLTNWQVLF